MNRTALRALVASCCVSAMAVVGFYVAQADEPAAAPTPTTTSTTHPWYGELPATSGTWDGTLKVEIKP